MNPGGGIAFDVAHDIGKTVGGAESGENVDVIRGPAADVGHTVHAADDAAEAFVDAGTVFRVQRWLAVLGAEDEMVIERETRRRHGGCFSRFCGSASHLPAVCGWAGRYPCRCEGVRRFCRPGADVSSGR